MIAHSKFSRKRYSPDLFLAKHYGSFDPLMKLHPGASIVTVIVAMVLPWPTQSHQSPRAGNLWPVSTFVLSIDVSVMARDGILILGLGGVAVFAWFLQCLKLTNVANYNIQPLELLRVSFSRKFQLTNVCCFLTVIFTANFYTILIRPIVFTMVRYIEFLE